MGSPAERTFLYLAALQQEQPHADLSLESAVSLLNAAEQMLPLYLCPLSAKHFLPLLVSFCVCMGKQKRGRVLLIREPLASRNWLVFLTLAELGHHDVVRS